jgi:hypothetical protein
VHIGFTATANNFGFRISTRPEETADNADTNFRNSEFPPSTREVHRSPRSTQIHTPPAQFGMTAPKRPTNSWVIEMRGSKVAANCCLIGRLVCHEAMDYWVRGIGIGVKRWAQAHPTGRNPTVGGLGPPQFVGRRARLPEVPFFALSGSNRPKRSAHRSVNAKSGSFAGSAYAVKRAETCKTLHRPGFRW